MNIENITYAEFSLLRELVRTKQLDIWKKEWAPHFGIKRSVEEMEEIFQKVMGYNVEVRYPLTNTDCCAMLLHRIDDAEKKVRESIQGGQNEI